MADLGTAKQWNSHGHSANGKRTRTYKAWQGLKERCTSPSKHNYEHYGGRGIGYCVRWENFVNFLEDMGECPPELTLDRIDNDDDYCPSNCRWATVSEQNYNQRPRPPVTHCKRGHEFTPENTQVDFRDHRRCATCHRDQERERYRKARAVK